MRGLGGRCARCCGASAGPAVCGAGADGERPTPPGRSHPGVRTQLISDFYAAQAKRLRAKVANKTGAPAEVVADACQVAWAILLRRPDISLDGRGLSWLTAVAVHEVYRQWRHRARNLPMGALSLGTGDP